MCDKAFFIHNILQNMIKCIPEYYDKDEIHYMKKLDVNLFHKAPEIVDEYWHDIYNHVSVKFSGDSDWEKKMCIIYNKGYQDYKKEFIHIY